MTRKEKMALAAEQPAWMYEFDLGDDIRTPLLADELRTIHRTREDLISQLLDARYPRGLQGLTALDVGCNEGYFSQMLCRRGAQVLAVDIRPGNIRRAQIVRQLAGLDPARLEFRTADFLAFTPASAFDITFALGLLYHLEDPMGALRKLRSLTRGVCLVESQVTRQSEPIRTGWGQTGVTLSVPASIAVYWEAEQDRDNLASAGGRLSFVPNLEALLLMMRTAGFARVEQLAPSPGMNPQYLENDRVVLAGYPQ